MLAAAVALLDDSILCSSFSGCGLQEIWAIPEELRRE